MNDDPGPPPPRRLSLARLIAYAAPAAPAAAIETPVSIYLPAFYAAAGLGLSTVGGLFLVARTLEAVAALALGAAADRFGQAAGRRLWMLAAAPLALAGLLALFLPPAEPTAGWLLAGLVAALVGAAGLQVSHTAWGAEAAGGYDERTRALAARQVAVVAGLVVVLAAPSLAASETARLRAIAMAFAVLLPVTVTAALLFGPRPAPVPLRSGWTWGAAWAALGRNRTLQRLLVIDLLDSAAFGVVASLFLLLSRDVWGLGPLASPLVLTYLVAGIVFLPALLRAFRGRRKSRAAACLALGLAAALPALLLVPAGAAIPAFAAVVVLGAPSAVNSALFDSLMADVAAADAEARGGVRTGLFFALHTLAGRIGRAVALALAFGLLDHLGFRPNASNSEAALMGFKTLYVGAPLVLQSAIAVLLWRFPEPECAPKVVRQNAVSTTK